MGAISRTKADARPVNDVLTREITMDVAVEAGQLVYVKSNGHGAIASSAAAGTTPALGVATMDCAANRAVALVTFGTFGGWSGMTPGAKVWLGPTGELNTAAGVAKQEIGIALSATDVYINPGKVAGVTGDLTKNEIPTGIAKVTLAAGTSSGADVTVAGMVVGDELVFVGSFTTAASIASLADRTAEYVVAAGKLTKAAGTVETNNQLLIIWNDLTV
jgi:hypothetical protein